MSARLWRVETVVPAPQAVEIEAALEAILGEACQATARMQQGEQWLVQALCVEAPQRRELERRLGVGVAVMPLPDADWVAEGLKHLPPVACGRVRIVGSHHPPPPTGGIGLLIDAGPAFGTGQHATTRGCLLALDWLERRLAPRRILDLGCGTGVLAMAAARLWARHVPTVVATDIDADSVAEAKRNAARNRLRSRLRFATADGFSHPLIRRSGPYDLILANILALPLIRLAPAIRRHLAPGGLAVLSGLLWEQEAAVRNAARAAGLPLVRRWPIGDWPTLVLRRK